MSAVVITMVDTEDGIQVRADLHGESERLIDLANMILAQLHVVESHNPDVLQIVRPTISLTAH